MSPTGGISTATTTGCLTRRRSTRAASTTIRVLRIVGLATRVDLMRVRQPVVVAVEIPPVGLIGAVRVQRAHAAERRRLALELVGDRVAVAVEVEVVGGLVPV